MLYSIVVNLKVQADAVIAPTQGYHAYALFLDILRQANPSLTQELHDTEGQKPFTISPLQGRFKRHRDGIALSAGGICWIRLTFLQEDTFAHFMDACIKAGGRTLKLDRALLELQEVVTAPGQSPLCRCESFGSLVENASFERVIGMRFLSPTAFRSKGRRNVMFPEPRLLFNSYLARWNSFSAEKLDEGLLPLVEKGARIARYKLETRILHFGSYQEIGFEGQCAVEVAEEVPEDTVKALNALADFSFYCGTGAKTTMGMGQTRRLGDGRSLSSRARVDVTQG